MVLGSQSGKGKANALCGDLPWLMPMQVSVCVPPWHMYVQYACIGFFCKQLPGALH